MVSIDSNPTIGIFRKKLRFFIQEKVYEIWILKSVQNVAKSLKTASPRGSLKTASPHIILRHVENQKYIVFYEEYLTLCVIWPDAVIVCESE